MTAPALSSVVSAQLLGLVPESGLVLTAGGIGSGKSCLNYGILESIHVREPGRPCFVFGLPEERAGLLPPWLQRTDSEEFAEGSAVLADEAYMAFYAKDHMTERNRFVDLFSGLARQKGILALYITQTTRKLTLAQGLGGPGMGDHPQDDAPHLPGPHQAG